MFSINKNLKVGARLAIGFGVMVVLLICIAVLAITRMRTINDSTKLIVKDRYPKVVIANTVLTHITDNAIQMRTLLLLDDPEKIKAEIAHFTDDQKLADDGIALLNNILTTEKGRKILQAIIDARDKYAAGQKTYLKLIAEGKNRKPRSCCCRR